MFKLFLPVSFLILLPQITQRQVAYKRTTLEILDKVEKTFKRFGGESESVKFSLIKRTVVADQDSKESTYVSVEIEAKESTEIITSSGFTITSNLDFAIGRSSASQIERLSGNIMLDKSDLEQVTQFLNETIQNTRSDLPNDIGWALEINERLKIALIYEKIGATNWKYYMALDGAEFEIPFQEGLGLMKKLVEFERLVD